MKLDRNRIIDICKLPEYKVHNIYLYGSQVYGNNTEYSDFDFLVTASSLDTHKEFRDGNYNVHIKTPDIFEDELRKHKISAIECVLAPKYAKVQEKDIIPFSFSFVELKRSILSDSHSSWVGGKRKILQGDMYRGMKSLWHSIRMLEFAIQILHEGHIYDFSISNSLYNEIMESDFVKWNDFKHLLLPKKQKMEEIVKDA